MRCCRIAFQMVAGRQVFHHPAIQGRHYILEKLRAFHRDHDTGMADVLRDLQAAVGQVPNANTRPRPGRWPRSYKRSRTVIGAVPNCSGISCRSCWHAWESAWYNPKSQGSRPPPWQVHEPRTPSVPKGQTLNKSMALSRITNA